MYYVYLLGDTPGINIGTTNDLASLLHRSPCPRYFKFSNRETAITFEKYLKSPSGKAFMRYHDFLDLYFLANALQYAYEKTLSKLYND